VLKIFCFGVLALLCSCSHNDSWAVNSIKTGSLEFDSSKLSYQSKDPIRGLDLEILNIRGQLHAYLQVRSHTITPYENNPKKALLTFIVEDTTYSDVALRHEGGQRVSLSEHMQEILISSLKKDLPVTVRLGSFETIITAEKFAKYYNELKL
jgi:hypothetical protein